MFHSIHETPSSFTPPYDYVPRLKITKRLLTVTSTRNFSSNRSLLIPLSHKVRVPCYSCPTGSRSGRCIKRPSHVLFLTCVFDS